MPEEMENKNRENDAYYGVGSFIFELIKIIALAFLIIVPIRMFLFQPFFVQGASMEPNFEDKQYLIINELGYKKTEVGAPGKTFFTVKPFKELERQVPIVFRYPLDTRKFFIKRVIGLPGEKLEIKNGQITIYNNENPNGFLLDESAYLSMGVRTSGEMVVMLKNNEYFVMGDNRSFSSDSRSWGPVEEKHIIGKVLVRAWPLNRLAVYP